MQIKHNTDLPLAADGFLSYRYQGLYGFIMIGAKDDADALYEASRTTKDKTKINKLERWDGEKYVPACGV